jgi:hypothetical protein
VLALVGWIERVAEGRVRFIEVGSIKILFAGSSKK